MTHDYKRNGTTTLFAALNVLDGQVIGECHARHRHQEWLRFLSRLDREFPPELTLHLIMDNYGTHKEPQVRAWLQQHPRFVCHFIPTSSSWLNLVERWFAELSEKAIRRGSFVSVPDLQAAIDSFLAAWNAQPKPFIWTATVDGAGNAYVADTENHTIRKVTPGGTVTTLAGLGGSSGSADGTGSAARFYWPYGVAVDSAGNVYVADTWNYTIRKVTPGGVVTTLAGLAGTGGSTDGTGSAARFNYPSGVAVDSAGTVYVADRGNHTIRKVTPGGAVTTLAGLADSYGSADGTGSAARFDSPRGVAVDSAGNVYVADYYNNTIRKVTPGGVVTTLAG
jgi:sugar lactone lactonase YvrE